MLGAARELTAERGIALVTMDAVAERAAVGKGTVYRAVGSRGGLAEALVDDAERALQDRVLRGRPPLGPGADPWARLGAFVSAYLRLLEDNVTLLVEVDHGQAGRRFSTGAHGFWRAHLVSLLREGGRPAPVLMAELVLGLLSADLYRHLRDDMALPAGVIRRETIDAALAVVRASPAKPSR